MLYDVFTYLHTYVHTYLKVIQWITGTPMHIARDYVTPGFLVRCESDGPFDWIISTPNSIPQTLN